MFAGLGLLRTLLQDFQKHPLYKYWNFEHDSNDEDRSTFGRVRYLLTDIRLRLPNEIRGFPMKAPHLFYTKLREGLHQHPHDPRHGAERVRGAA